MKYPIAIEIGDDKHAYGVVVPDLPGCYSAGDSLEEAVESAKEAIAGWIEVELEGGHSIPPASSMEMITKCKEFEGWLFEIVDVDI